MADLNYFYCDRDDSLEERDLLLLRYLLNLGHSLFLNYRVITNVQASHKTDIHRQVEGRGCPLVCQLFLLEVSSRRDLTHPYR